MRNGALTLGCSRTDASHAQPSCGAGLCWAEHGLHSTEHHLLSATQSCDQEVLTMMRLLKQ